MAPPPRYENHETRGRIRSLTRLLELSYLLTGQLSLHKFQCIAESTNLPPQACSASSASGILPSQYSPPPILSSPTRSYDGHPKTLFQAHHSWLELIEFRSPYMIALANASSVAPGTTIQVPTSSQYRTEPRSNNPQTHLDSLAD